MNATTYDLLKREIEKRQNIISGMNNISNWTNDMIQMEETLINEINDLISSSNALSEDNENAYINSQY